MALTKCKECAQEVSTKAKSCPKCGAELKSSSSCLSTIAGLAICLFIVFVILGALASRDQETEAVPGQGVPIAGSRAAAAPTVAEEGQTVSVGYTSYQVVGSRWSQRVSANEYVDEKPNASFLLIEVVVRNDDKEARVVPPFKLVDDSGAQHDESSAALMADNSFGIIQSLNPSVQKRGVLVFDVPPDRSYSLLVSGGFWSKASAMIRLQPKR